LPKAINAMPRSTTATPSVMVMRMKCGALRIGASVRRSCAAASAAQASTAMTIAKPSGTCSVSSHADRMPPSITYSPCAKLTTRTHWR